MIGASRFGRVPLGLLGACASLLLFAIVPAIASTARGGVWANTQLCLRGGWQHLARADGTPFQNVVGCIWYALRGGAITDPRGPAALYCDRVGGTFGSARSGGANNLTGPFPAGGLAPWSSTSRATARH